MVCRGCGNPEAFRTRTHEDDSEVCNECGNLGSLSVPDVYFPGPYHDPHLAHPNRPWEAEKGPLVTSKAHKRALMKEQQLREKGDRVHGAINFDPKLAAKAKEVGLGPST